MKRVSLALPLVRTKPQGEMQHSGGDKMIMVGISAHVPGPPACSVSPSFHTSTVETTPPMGTSGYMRYPDSCFKEMEKDMLHS